MEANIISMWVNGQRTKRNDEKDEMARGLHEWLADKCTKNEMKMMRN